MSEPVQPRHILDCHVSFQKESCIVSQSYWYKPFQELFVLLRERYAGCWTRQSEGATFLFPKTKQRLLHGRSGHIDSMLYQETLYSVVAITILHQNRDLQSPFLVSCAHSADTNLREIKARNFDILSLRQHRPAHHSCTS